MNSSFQARDLPRHVAGARSTVLWGMGLLVVIESMVVLSLVASYFYLRLHAPAWPPDGLPAPDALAEAPKFAILLSSAVPVALAERGVARGRQGALRAGLVLGMVLAAAYAALSVHGAATRSFSWKANAYASVVWTVEGYQLMHVLALLTLGGAVTALAFRGHFHEERRVAVQATALYWYFAAASSALSYAAIYLTPHLS